MRRAYLNPDNVLRASIVSDPAGARVEHKDNTPAVVHIEVVPGNTVDVQVAAKGGGSENKSKMAVLNPSDSIVDWVVKTVPTMGAGWCPPGMLGIGIGGTAEKAAVMAKEALMDPIDIHELKKRGAANRVEELRLEIFDAVNRLGIGAQGLGGLTTVVDVKIKDYPDARRVAAGVHDSELRRDAARALRARRFRSCTAGTAAEPRRLAERSHGTQVRTARRVNLDTVTRDDVLAWQPGETVLLSGKMLTGRDAAHKRIAGSVCERRRVCRRASISTASSSTTSARSIRCATKWSAPQARRRRRGWTSSPT